MGMTNAERQARWRERHPEVGNQRREALREDPAYRKAENARRGKRGAKPFGAFDTEGCEINGRHETILVRADELRLGDGSALGWREMLDFIIGMPKTRHWVGFSIGYDVTMILRGILGEPGGEDFLRRLMDAEYGTPTTWEDYQIVWRERKALEVGRVGGGPATVIHDVFTLFQSSFLKAVTTFGVATPAERVELDQMKSRRNQFSVEELESIDHYCALENRLLVRLMDDVKAKFRVGGIDGKSWEGPGPIASGVIAARTPLWRENYRGKGKDTKLAEHRAQEARGGRLVRLAHDDGPADKARQTYFGGRFERTLAGAWHGDPVYQYDINSAYPDAMRRLPCLEHGVWAEVPGIDELDPGDLAMVYGDFAPPEWGGWFGLPHRDRIGRVSYPDRVIGVYWWHELWAAWDGRPQPHFVFGKVWKFERRCECQPFRWVEDMYEERKVLEGRSKGTGIGHKLALNSAYGKTAQREGDPPHHNMIYASLITSWTRVKLQEVLNRLGGRVLMVATDAVFIAGRDPVLETVTGPKVLGEWERSGPYNDFFVWGPGMYFDGASGLMKTRGVRKDILAGAVARMREACETDGDAAVDVTYRQFHGLRLGLHLGGRHVKDIGQWLDETRTLRLRGDSHKRDHDRAWADGWGTRILPPPRHGMVLDSYPYPPLGSPDGDKLVLEWSEGRREQETLYMMGEDIGVSGEGL